MMVDGNDSEFSLNVDAVPKNDLSWNSLKSMEEISGDQPLHEESWIGP